MPEASDASAIIYANFDADNWLVDLVKDLGAPGEVVDNVEPLEALGMSSWTEGDEVHTLLTVTTQ